jgi:amidase
MQELWRLSAIDLAQLVRTKEVSAQEAAMSALARLDAVNPMINAVVDHRPDDVLQQANAVDAAIARGEDTGVLAGVPVTIKVNIDQAGYASTNGLNLQRELIATANSPIVEICERLELSFSAVLIRLHFPIAGSPAI